MENKEKILNSVVHLSGPFSEDDPSKDISYNFMQTDEYSDEYLKHETPKTLA